MPTASKHLIQLHPLDNVAVVLKPGGLVAGDTWETGGRSGVLLQDVPWGHKVSLEEIGPGAAIVKYGHTMAQATRAIRAGGHVHVHNAAMPAVITPESEASRASAPAAAAWATLPATFDGYRREAGPGGTRNHLLVAATVNCSATVVKAVCRHFLGTDLASRGIHGVVPLTHGSGCAQAVGGEAYQVLNRTLAGTIFHPNAVAALVMGLGCEGTTFHSILESRRQSGSRWNLPIEHLDIQDSGGTEAAIRGGIVAVERLLARLPSFRREPLPVSDLRLALNCGGSDAFSGLTANPALGVASDILVAKGGTVALAEIPECHGAEGLLRGRAADPAQRADLDRVFEWWQNYAERQGVSLNNNLAPGNIEGGITTILEKSLGAVAKAGTSPLTSVVGYAQPLETAGFALMNTPGFDPVSVTGLVAGGCNLVAFTTGRGSAYGCAVAPTVKISTTTSLFERMPGDMDFDAGSVLEEGSPAPAGIRLYEQLIRVAGGEATCSERLGLGWEEFVPWAIGETL